MSQTSVAKAKGAKNETGTGALQYAASDLLFSSNITGKGKLQNVVCCQATSKHFKGFLLRTALPFVICNQARSFSRRKICLPSIYHFGHTFTLSVRWYWVSCALETSLMLTDSTAAFNFISFSLKVALEN